MKEKLQFSVTKKDFEVTWFSGTGGGGQHRNKNQNCCRLKHKDTGIIKTGQSYKERPRNQQQALNSMSKDKKFQAYCNQKLQELEDGITFEEKVEEMMAPENLRIECKDENNDWVEYE